MRKLFFILPVLFSYLLILGHDIIPHEHHVHTTFQESIEINHHHAHDHSVSHAHKSQSHPTKEEHPDDFFGHFFNLVYTFSGNIYLIDGDKQEKEIKLYSDLYFFCFNLYLINGYPRQLKLPTHPDPIYAFQFLRFSSLRGPPNLI